MSVLERPEITSFINTWRGKPKEQVVEEIASYSLETKGIPDPYYFTVTATGELFSPTAHCRIKDAVEDKTGPLGRLEYQAVLAIERWVAQSNDGAVVWVSPPYPGIYPTSKVIISEIGYGDGVKKLFNRAIVLDLNEIECIKFAWNLTSFSRNMPVFTHLDQIRATPIILNTQDSPWIDILEGLIDDPALWESIRNGEDQRAKKEAVERAGMVQKEFFSSLEHQYPHEAEVEVLQMLGPRSGSCPVVLKSTGFQVFAGSSLISTGSSFLESDSKGVLCFPCPACGAINKRPREGYVERCQNPSCPSPEAVCC